MKRQHRNDLASNRATALRLTPVSRETLARLDRFVELLLAWQGTTNLVANSTLGEIWTRHVADSLQLLDLAPNAGNWIDLGSGAGFPGVVIACALADRTHETTAGPPEQARAVVHLVESNAKKAAFLRESVRATGALAVVHAERIETFAGRFHTRADVVMARALAPLAKLLDLSAPLLTTGACGLFLKGQDVELELTEASKYWNMRSTLVQSRTDPHGRIVVVQGLQRRASARQSGDSRPPS